MDGGCALACGGATPTLCGDSCVDTDTDRAHCGACGTSCEAGEICADGGCVVSCMTGFEVCDDACTDTQYDPSHCGGCGMACAAGEACVEAICRALAPSGFILSRRDGGSLERWNPATGATSVLHSITTNDGDCNSAEGSASGWWANHVNDTFGAFTYGAGTGSTSSFMTPYAYPKHLAVFNGELIVMSRNDRTVHRYAFDGASRGTFVVPGTAGQGVATDGTDLYVSSWNGTVSQIHRYDATFTFVQTYANPSGLGANNNVVDLAWDAARGNWIGIVTAGEGGTLTNCTQAVRFTMGGSVLETYTLPFGADGIGLDACR